MFILIPVNEISSNPPFKVEWARITIFFKPSSVVSTLDQAFISNFYTD